MHWLFKKEKNQSKQFEALSEKLERRKSEHIEELKEKHKEVVRWAKKKGIKTEEVIQKSAKGLATGVAAGAMIFSSGIPSTVDESQKPNDKELQREIDDRTVEVSIIAKKDISKEIQKELSTVNPYDEKIVQKKLNTILNIPVKAKLDGIRLNTTYGIMGYESHLTRYPGDNISTHFVSNLDHQKYGHASMAGGPGAWGYIAQSKGAISQKDIEREKYYLVAQTFLSPNWGSAEVKKWFRHRKMVVVNPQSGAVVVGVLEDAGPEPQTGKKFGGSPEIMEILGFSGSGNNVYMYFVEDPEDKIPLGSYGL